MEWFSVSILMSLSINPHECSINPYESQYQCSWVSVSILMSLSINPHESPVEVGMVRFINELVSALTGLAIDDKIIFTVTGFPFALKPMALTFHQVCLFWKPFRDWLWWRTSTSLEQSDLVELTDDDLSDLVGESVDCEGWRCIVHQLSKSCLERWWKDFLHVPKHKCMETIVGVDKWLKFRLAYTSQWIWKTTSIVDTHIWQWAGRGSCQDVQKIVFVSRWNDKLFEPESSAKMPDYHRHKSHWHEDSWRHHWVPAGCRMLYRQRWQCRKARRKTNRLNTSVDDKCLLVWKNVSWLVQRPSAASRKQTAEPNHLLCESPIQWVSYGEWQRDHHLILSHQIVVCDEHGEPCTQAEHSGASNDIHDSSLAIMCSRGGLLMMSCSVATLLTQEQVFRDAR